MESSSHGPGVHSSWEKLPAQLSSAQQGSSLVISECHCGSPTLPVLLWSHQHRSQIPAEPRNELLLLTGHTQELHKPLLLTHLCRTSQPPPRGALEAGDRHSHTLGSHQGSTSQQETDGTKPIKSRLRPCPTQVWTGCH